MVVGAKKGDVVCGGDGAPKGDGPIPVEYERVVDGIGNPVIAAVLGADGVVNVVGVFITDGGGGSRVISPVTATPTVVGRPVVTEDGPASNASNAATISSSSKSRTKGSDAMTQNHTTR